MKDHGDTVKVSVIGLGYVGLPTALIAAQSGFDVAGYDYDAEKVRTINGGISPIAEKGAQKLLEVVLNEGSFKAYAELQRADYFIIAVPTPFQEGKRADLRYVFEAITTVAQKLLPGNTVIIESTIPVGATRQVAHQLEKLTGLVCGQDFFVSHCPERVLPGKIIEELVSNDRVIGGICSVSGQKSAAFYKPFVKGSITVTDDQTAEMVKLVENSYRDVQISFANQLDAMCKTVGINAFEVISLANRHPRVKILEPGCGVGGHCVAVDPWFLIEGFPHQTPLLKAARDINDAKPHHVIHELSVAIDTFMQQHQRKPVVSVLGLAFKPDVEDLRESPALQIALALKAKREKCELLVCEPNVHEETLSSLGFERVVGIWQALESSDIVALLVKHKEFLLIPLMALQKKIVIDPCGIMASQKRDLEDHHYTFKSSLVLKSNKPHFENSL